MEEDTAILRERRSFRERPSSTPPREGGSRGPIYLVLAALLAVVPLLAGLGHDFYQDDYTWLEQAYRAGSSPLAVLTPWKSFEVRSLGQGLFALELAVFGQHPFGFNLVSLLIHLASGLLVARIALFSGLRRPAALAAGLLFVGGFGHYTKPATWACAQVVLLSTFLVLAAFAVFLRPGPPRFPFVPFLLLVAALAAHEIVILAPLGLAWLAWRTGHPRRRAILATALLLTVVYSALTLAVHTRHPVARSSVTTLLGNPFLMAATYLVPPQAIGVIEGVLPRSDLRFLAPAVRVGVYAVGAALLAAILLLVRISPSPLRRLAVVGGLLALPPLAFPMPPGWFEARYLYPVTAFLAPAAVLAVTRLYQASASAGRRALVATVVLWSLLVVAGSCYMQWKAYAQGASPGAEYRRTQLQEFLRAEGKGEFRRNDR